MTKQTISASKRDATGPGGARATRRAGRMPANLYGGGKTPLAISVDPLEVTKTYHQGNFLSTVLTLDVDGEATQALPREIQTHPVKDNVLHVDFLRVDETTRINVDVPVHFINEEMSPGLTRGGVVNVVRHEVELSCPAMAIPAYIEGNLDGLDIGDLIKISAIKLPEGVTPTITDRDFTVATVAAPTIEIEVEEEVPEEGEEGELLDGEEGAETAEGEAPTADKEKDKDKEKEGEGKSNR
jgi:large subunit ribosomal protein L25